MVLAYTWVWVYISVSALHGRRVLAYIWVWVYTLALACIWALVYRLGVHRVREAPEYHMTSPCSQLLELLVIHIHPRVWERHMRTLWDPWESHIGLPL